MFTEREMLNLKVYAIMKDVKTMYESKEAKSLEWETRCYEAEAEVITCEDLIFFYDTPEMNRRIAKAYNRLRHYQHIYHRICDECEELEEALEGLKKAEYWL